MTFYIDANKTGAAREISSLLKNCILHHRKSWKELVFLCIGTDRLTGDCLGPYVGQQLLCNASEKVHVYGTLSHPVHALNLTSASQDICFSHPEALVIAVDSFSWTKKAPGLRNHRRRRALPGCCGSERAAPCRGHPCNRNRKYSRITGAAYSPDNPAVYCHSSG